MDPRRACWEMSSSEDVARPLLPVHDDDDSGPARARSCAGLAALLGNKYLAVASGPVACALICALVDLGAHPAARNMLGVLAWVFLWWITDAVPLAVASMAPLFLFPAFGIASADDVAKAYMDDVIALVLGSFILALAIEHYSIHRRLALNITALFCGDPVKPHLLLLGICGTTMFISMWIHNTACTVMMMPVATGILQRLPRDELEGGQGSDARQVQRFSKAVVLGVVYASAVGGMATLTGTGVNIILVGMWSTYFPEQGPITFSSWMSFGLPMSLVLFLALWATLCLMYCSKDTGRALSAYLDRSHLRRELSLLGPMAFAEKMVLAVFGGLIVLWMTRSLTDDIPGWSVLFDGKVGDGTVTVSNTNNNPRLSTSSFIREFTGPQHANDAYMCTDHDGDAAVHHPERQERRREADGLGQVPEAAVEHHPAPRRGLRDRRRVQGERPDGHPVRGPGLPARRPRAGHRARGVRLQRRHHRVHLRRRHHHAGAAAAGRAGQVHRRAPAAAHGPRRDRRAAVVPAAHGLARQRLRVRHRVHHHQGHGGHRDAAEDRRRRCSDDPSTDTGFLGIWHVPEILLGTWTGHSRQMFWNISRLFGCPTQRSQATILLLSTAQPFQNAYSLV